MNQNFFCLPKEKQQKILNAAFLGFSKNDYTKVSTESIAKEANISKSLLFHYFESKKGLYLFLYEYGVEFITAKMQVSVDFTETDLFKLIISAQTSKCNIMKEHPHIFTFLLKAYYEECPDIVSEISGKIKVLSENNIEFMLTLVDRKKFKDNVDINLLIKTIIWCSDGYMREKYLDKPMDLDRINKEFQEVLFMFRNNFYKEEYLE